MIRKIACSKVQISLQAIYLCRQFSLSLHLV